MKKKEAQEIAKDLLQHAIGIASYELNDNYSESDIKLISDYIDKYAIRMCKIISREYISY